MSSASFSYSHVKAKTGDLLDDQLFQKADTNKDKRIDAEELKANGAVPLVLGILMLPEGNHKPVNRAQLISDVAATVKEAGATKEIESAARSGLAEVPAVAELLSALGSEVKARAERPLPPSSVKKSEVSAAGPTLALEVGKEFVKAAVTRNLDAEIVAETLERADRSPRGDEALAKLTKSLLELGEGETAKAKKLLKDFRP